jgi:hypothetical protein
MKTNPSRPLDVAVLYDFHDLSEEEFRFRIESRGDANHLNQTIEYRNQTVFDVFDDTHWKFFGSQFLHINELTLFKIWGNTRG